MSRVEKVRLAMMIINKAKIKHEKDEEVRAVVKKMIKQLKQKAK